MSPTLTKLMPKFRVQRLPNGVRFVGVYGQVLKEHLAHCGIKRTPEIEPNDTYTVFFETGMFSSAPNT